MIDRYLFRGRRLDNGKWVKGYYVGPMNCVGEKYSNHFIYFASGPRTKVDPTTVGQCTGLRDKNGTLIFEGDFATDSKTGSHTEGYTGVVKWVGDEKPFMTCAYEVHLWAKGRVNSYRRQISKSESDRLTVIGNIHDNPELLEVDKP